MLESLHEVEEGFDGKGSSFLVQAIAARGSKCSWRERFGELRHEHPGTPELFQQAPQGSG